MFRGLCLMSWMPLIHCLKAHKKLCYRHRLHVLLLAARLAHIILFRIQTCLWPDPSFPTPSASSLLIFMFVLFNIFPFIFFYSSFHLNLNLCYFHSYVPCPPCWPLSERCFFIPLHCVFLVFPYFGSCIFICMSLILYV